MMTRVQWNATVGGGTSLRGYWPEDTLGLSFEETVARLKTLSGLDPTAQADEEKTSVEFAGYFDGQPFTLYDYEGDRSLHVGGSPDLDVDGLLAVLTEALTTVVPTEYHTADPDEYGGLPHGWPAETPKGWY